MGDARVSPAEIFDAFGVDAIVTRPSQDAIETSVVWINPTTDPFPSGAALQMADPQRLLTVRRDEVPTLPTGTVIQAPEFEDGPIKTWKVDSIAHYEADLIRALVVPHEFES